MMVGPTGVGSSERRRPVRVGEFAGGCTLPETRPELLASSQETAGVSSRMRLRSTRGGSRSNTPYTLAIQVILVSCTSPPTAHLRSTETLRPSCPVADSENRRVVLHSPPSERLLDSLHACTTAFDVEAINISEAWDINPLLDVPNLEGISFGSRWFSPRELARARSLSSNDLAGEATTGLGSIVFLRRLESLDLSKTYLRYEEIAVLASSEISTLQLPSLLEEIPYIPRLRSLVVHHSQLGAIPARLLEQLDHLTVINRTRAPVSITVPFSLDSLVLDGAFRLALADAGPSRLRHFSIETSADFDTSALSEMTELETLSVIALDFDASPLEHLSLRELSLEVRSVVGFPQGVDVSRLASLRFSSADEASGRRILGIFASASPPIRRLVLAGNRWLHSLPTALLNEGLRELNISDTSISSIASLRTCTRLQTLEAQELSLADSSVLRSLGHLTTASFRRSRGVSCRDLPETLEVLDLGGAELTAVDELGSLVRLRSLDLSDVPMNNVEWICSNHRLESLSVARSGIAEIACLSELSSLHRIESGGHRAAAVVAQSATHVVSTGEVRVPARGCRVESVMSAGGQASLRSYADCPVRAIRFRSRDSVLELKGHRNLEVFHALNRLSRLTIGRQMPRLATVSCLGCDEVVVSDGLLLNEVSTLGRVTARRPPRVLSAAIGASDGQGWCDGVVAADIRVESPVDWSECTSLRSLIVRGSPGVLRGLERAPLVQIAIRVPIPEIASLPNGVRYIDTCGMERALRQDEFPSSVVAVRGSVAVESGGLRVTACD